MKKNIYNNFESFVEKYKNTKSGLGKKIIIEKVNPSLRLVFVGDVILKNEDAEITITKFRLDSEGNFKSIYATNEILTPYSLKGY